MMSPRWRGALGWAAVVALFFALQAFMNRDMASGRPPAIDGLSLSGRPADLEAFRGRPVLIYFWASWCSICRAMEDKIGSLARDYPVITLAFQSGDAAEVARYVGDQHLDWPVVPDPEGVNGERYGIRGVPAFFILAPDGSIRSSSVGFTTEWALRLRLWLAGR